MRITDYGDSIYITLSPTDTYRWAHRHNNYWPCSELSGKRVQALFDDTGLLEFKVNNKDDVEVDHHEFNAIISDHLEEWGMHEEHKLHYLLIGQFKDG